MVPSACPALTFLAMRVPQAALSSIATLPDAPQNGVQWKVLRSGGVPLLTALLADGNAVRRTRSAVLMSTTSPVRTQRSFVPDATTSLRPAARRGLLWMQGTVDVSQDGWRKVRSQQERSIRACPRVQHSV